MRELNKKGYTIKIIKSENQEQNNERCINPTCITCDLASELQRFTCEDESQKPSPIDILEFPAPSLHELEI